MTPAEALADARGYAAANRVRFSRPHAYDKMDKTHVGERDVVHALANARRCRPGNYPGSWKLTGQDLSGEDLDVVIEFEGGIYVVTLM